MKRFQSKIVKKSCQNILSFFILLTILVITSCSKNEKNLKSFYFPFEKLEKGLVYEYKSLNDMPTEYWMYFSKKIEEKYQIRSVNITPNGKKIQEVIEKEVSNGMKMVEYNLFNYDSLGRQITTALDILSPASFSFAEPDTSNIYIFKAKLQDPFDETISTTIIKNKKFSRFDTFNYNGTDYPIIVINIKELIEQEKKDDGYLTPPSYDGEEWFAEGLGLVYYKKDINDDFKMEFRLNNIMTINEFNSSINSKSHE